MQKISNYIFSALSLLVLDVAAQKFIKNDTTTERIRISAFRVAFDVVHPIKTFATTDFSGLEVAADAEIKNYYPIIELGRWSRDVSLTNGQYKNNGTYWRVGADVNFLKRDPVKNMFFFGIRYGHSQYNEQLTYTFTTKEFGTIEKFAENKKLKSEWFELVTGMRVKIKGGFWMGYTGRIKLAPGLHEENQLQSYDIPGYGLTFKKPWWGFNYYLMWKFSTKAK